MISCIILRPMSVGNLTLYTFAISHFSEKIRWTLDASGLKYTEVVMTPFLHLMPALLMGGRGETTLPILKCSPSGQGQAQHIQDSTAILRWLDEQLGPWPLMPPDRSLREDIMGIEDRFDAIGKDIARYLYLTGLERDDEVFDLWTGHASPGQIRLLRLAFPVVKWGFKRRLSITATAAAQSELRIQQALAWLDGRISDGRLYLSGNQLSVADITAASILSPLVCPVQHPLYGSESFRQRPWHPPTWLGERPGVAWVRRMYEAHRLPSVKQQAVA
ncbi:MAG: glutathione S-transferase family protein [Rubrivivax sp.]|nr:MAG: glutathione S-transferase family protein [Rubrivivax sp.]